MSKVTAPLIERLDDNESEVNSLKVIVGKLEERVELGFENTNKQLDKIDGKVDQLITVERERELTALRKKWGIASKVIGAILMAVLGGLIKLGIDKL
jgi:hypothetical protein